MIIKVISRLAVVILVILGISSIREGISGLRGNAKSEPQPITCEKLSASGPGDNGYVLITDVHPLINQVVIFGGDGKTAWTDAYIPLVPTGSKSPNEFHLLLHSRILNTSGDFRKFKKVNEVSGLISTRASELGEAVKPVVLKSFPTLDLPNCYIVEHEVIVISKGTGVILCIVGVALIAGAGLLVMKLLPKRAVSLQVS